MLDFKLVYCLTSENYYKRNNINEKSLKVKQSRKL
jgi:hypothetical protein